ncbi:hypothetical protein BH10PSE3_BH10PSE3_33860 [soil metagenome]
MFTELEIARRMPLWCALAELFLDTEMQTGNYEAVAQAARDSGFTAVEVRDILENEMWPAFSFNLLDIAGEWAGFSDDYVRTRMEETLAGTNRWSIGDLGFRSRFMRQEWPAIEAALEGRAVCLPSAPERQNPPHRLVLTVICLGVLLLGLIMVLH